MARQASYRPALEDLPDDARVWIFGSDRSLTDQETARLREATVRFIDGWAAHGEGLAAAFDWRHGRFLIVAVDERRAPASGCSIDALVRHVRELEEKLALHLVDGSPVWYRSGEGIRRVDRQGFRRLAEAGEVNTASVVFDLTVQRLGDLRAGRWELPAGSSWHARLLPTDIG